MFFWCFFCTKSVVYQSVSGFGKANFVLLPGEWPAPTCFLVNCVCLLIKALCHLHLSNAMTTVYHELLPESYLLLLTPGSPEALEYALEDSLKCACRSGKAAVWVDCEFLGNSLSKEAARTLWDYHHMLQGQHKKMVVVHASEEVKQTLLSWRLSPSICFAQTLIDAAWQSGLRLVA
jgi:hypothetical protein